MKKYDPISKAFPHVLHGGDYNPDQWKKYPEIIEEDMRLLKEANCNCVSIGIFSWATLEPEEGKYDFTFFDELIEKLHKNGIKVVLATPSGSKPMWMAKKYPEIRRTNNMLLKEPMGDRHNHCYTSPIYREKVRAINTRLAERYGNHPAVIAWHISNEYSGECHCPLCQEAFRAWLKNKYSNDLDKLNDAWWTGFWSHTFTEWDQIASPPVSGGGSIHGLVIDFMRFVTDQTIDFMKNEIEPIRKISPHLPITTNMMNLYPGLNYRKFAEHIDIMSHDSYPCWHAPCGNAQIAKETAFIHDLYRSMKGGKPFMLMESTPSMVNWMGINTLKQPKMHYAASMQAVAHGSDTVQYFQWRKGRGGSEKFHGAVVDHYGKSDTRVFRDVKNLGTDLAKLDCIPGTRTKSEVALVYDWENRWAIEALQGLRQDNRQYQETCMAHYTPFWRAGVNVDIISLDDDISNYKLLVAPMLYMMKPQWKEKIKSFVERGGTIVCTYMTGMVDENDLCYLGGFPAEDLKDVFGIWAQEINTLFDSAKDTAVIDTDALSFKGRYKVDTYTEIIEPRTAEVLGTYENNFYAGTPCLTRNKYGKGYAYYIAFRDDNSFTQSFYDDMIDKLSITRGLDAPLPEGMSVHTRYDEQYTYYFVQNFSENDYTVDLPHDKFEFVLTGEKAGTHLNCESLSVQILRAPNLKED